jgi:antitoxin HigA-1
MHSMWKSPTITNAMKTLPPVHPGEILLEDFMKPLGLSQYRVALDLGVPALRISQIVRGMRAISADTALRLARYFGTSPSIWLRLQARYDMEVAQRKFGKLIEKQVPMLVREPDAALPARTRKGR